MAFSSRSFALSWGFWEVNPSSRTTCQVRTGPNASLVVFFKTSARAAHRPEIRAVAARKRPLENGFPEFLASLAIEGGGESGRTLGIKAFHPFRVPSRIPFACSGAAHPEPFRDLGLRFSLPEHDPRLPPPRFPLS